MSTDRFNKAARDGYLDALKEATRKDLNTRDEDGMTPTLWASFEGNLDALRLIVGRGGDPDKSDNYGNTALHFAAVNFGCNMWARDIDYHTPKDLAAINNKEEILRFLDASIAKEEAKDKKKVKSYIEKAKKDAEKRVKEFDKLQKKASKSVEEEQKKLMKRREKMDKKGGLSATPHLISESGMPEFPPQLTPQQQQPPPHHPHSALSFLSLRKDTRPVQNSGSHSFSELVTHSSAKMKGGGLHTGVYKKVQQRKTLNSAKATGSDFKVGDVTDGGKRSVRSLSGLRRDNEVMYVPKFDITAANNGRRGKISGLFENEEGGLSSGRRQSVRSGDGGGGSEPEGDGDEDSHEMMRSRLTRSHSQPDYIHEAGVVHTSSSSRFNEESSTARDHQHQSIFERPGFGSVAFRKNMNSTLSNFTSFSHHPQQHPSSHHHHNGNGRTEAVLLEEDDNDLHRDSIGSASSLDGTSSKAQLSHHNQSGWEEPGSGDEEELGSLEVFLAAANLMNYAHIFVKEKIDFQALLLLTDEDFKSMGIELGPRRKLLNAIGERQRVMENPGEVIDSRL